MTRFTPQLRLSSWGFPGDVMSNVIESLNSWFHASQQGCLSCETCGECPDEDYKKWIALLEFLSLSSSFCRFELPAQSVSLSSRRSLLLLSAFPGMVARPVRSHAQLQSSLILDRANGATTCVLQRMLPGEECRFSPARGAREVITVCDVGPNFLAVSRSNEDGEIGPRK